MRIWILTTSYPRTPEESRNAGVLARQVALLSVDEGHSVRVVTPNKPGGVVADSQLEVSTIPWPWPTTELADIDPRRPKDFIRAALLLISGWRLVRKLADVDPPDAVVAMWALPSAFFARAIKYKTGTPYSVWLLGSDVWRARGIPAARKALRWGLSKANAVYADGTDLAAAAHKLTGKQVEFLPSSRVLPNVSGPKAEGPDFVFVGRYHRNKGPDILIEALRILAAEEITPIVHLYGDGPMRSQLTSDVALFGLDSSVSIGGPIDAADLAASLRSSRALIIPSRQESIPMVLADAIQLRTPVVASDVGDLGELVTRFGIGWIVEPEDPSILAEALKSVLLGASAESLWDDAIEFFDPHLTVGRLLESLSTNQ